jgi:hypothetical protein
MPKPLDGAEHYTDMAIIPMQMLTAPYMESAISSSAKSKLNKLYAEQEETEELYLLGRRRTERGRRRVR